MIYYKGWYNDLVGQIFGRLTITEHIGVVNGFRLVKAKCDCGGEEKTFRFQNLCKSKKPTQSCGCLGLENHRKLIIHFTKHNDCNSRLYKIWTGIKSRTSNKNTACFDNYMGRGISMCEEWKDYLVFKAWAISNGYKDNLTIDRYPNVNGNYEPSNCRWATTAEQNANRRCTLKLVVNNIEKPLSEWARIHNITYRSLFDRVKRGWPPERLFIPNRAY